MPLVSFDKSWAVCMPKKTASQSLVGMCESVAEVLGEYHGALWDGDGQRFMVVREPRERLASMCWFAINKQDGFYGPGGPDAWLERFLDAVDLHKPDHAEWVASQSELAKAFKPDRVFCLEDGLGEILRALGVTVDSVQYRNRTDGKHAIRRSFNDTFSAKISSRLNNWLTLDAGDWY